MKFFNIPSLSIVFLAGLLGATLLYVSQKVQDSSEKLTHLERQVSREKENINVLEAEWEYLNAPQRLEKLAVEYFGVSAPSAAQMLGEEEGLNLPFPAPIESTPDKFLHPASHSVSYKEEEPL